MNKHAPGPWRTTEHQVLVMSGEMTVADVRVNDAPYEEQAANARLIAAAPDLLDACELWDQGFIDGEEFDADQFLAWVNRNRAAARAAIAKARGAD